jgi:hypothetical protein
VHDLIVFLDGPVPANALAASYNPALVVLNEEAQCEAAV